MELGTLSLYFKVLRCRKPTATAHGTYTGGPGFLPLDTKLLTSIFWRLTSSGLQSGGPNPGPLVPALVKDMYVHLYVLIPTSKPQVVSGPHQFSAEAMTSTRWCILASFMIVSGKTKQRR